MTTTFLNQRFIVDLATRARPTVMPQSGAFCHQHFNRYQPIISGFWLSNLPISCPLRVNYILTAVSPLIIWAALLEQPREMLYSLRSHWNKRRFGWLTRAILRSPPIHLVDANWSIVSMVSNTDVQMYLLSIKSLYARIGRGKIVAIIDHDMPQHLRQLLRHHIVGIQFVILEDIETRRCQRGGTWERLVFLLDHAQHEYMIQVDSDTLAFGADLAEVLECVESNRAFTLSNAGQSIRSMREYAENAQKLESRYVGIHAERLFDRYPGSDQLCYVRGSSGLAGFAVGAFDPATIEDFHENMRRAMGDEAWRKWGTEQCGSNFAVANSPGAAVLPYPKYANYSPDLQPGAYSFLHFIGTHRYDNDFFATKGQEVIQELLTA